MIRLKTNRGRPNPLNKVVGDWEEPFVVWESGSLGERRPVEGVLVPLEDLFRVGRAPQAENIKQATLDFNHPAPKVVDGKMGRLDP